jgi:PilZ domain
MQGTAEFEQRTVAGRIDGAGAFRRLASWNGASENDPLGRAYLESSKKLSVGDSIKLEVRAGLRRIHFTAVVRNIGPQGNGVEFVYVKDEDREKLRKLVQWHLQF